MGLVDKRSLITSITTDICSRCNLFQGSNSNCKCVVLQAIYTIQRAPEVTAKSAKTSWVNIVQTDSSYNGGNDVFTYHCKNCGERYTAFNSAYAPRFCQKCGYESTNYQIPVEKLYAQQK